MDISRQRKKLFLVDHDDRFGPRRFSGFLQIKLAIHRYNKNIMIPLLVFSHQRLEDRIGVFADSLGHGLAIDDFWVVYLLYVYHLGGIQ